MPNVTRFVQMAVLRERFQIAPQMQFWNVNYARNRRGLSLKCLFMIFIIIICEIRMYQLKEEMLQCTNVKKRVKLPYLCPAIYADYAVQQSATPDSFCHGGSPLTNDSETV